MSPDDQLDLERIEAIFAAVAEVGLAYLFGSRVEGKLGPLSDFDFAVLLSSTANLPQIRSRLAHELAAALGTGQVDLVVLNQAPIELSYAVIAHGRLLFQRDDFTRVEYEAHVLSRYGDYLPVLRAQQREICEGGEDAARIQRYRAALGRTERTLDEIGAAHRKTARRIRR